MTAEMTAPAWRHQQVTAEQYATWTQEQCAGIEIVDGMVLVSPSASKRHNRLARIVANALDAAAGPQWNADLDVDVRLQDVPLNNRRPDVTVYRADTIDVVPTRPEDILLVVEVVSPGSETTDRIVKADQYAKAGIAFYWRIEQAATGIPLTYTHVLDPDHLTAQPRLVTLTAIAPGDVELAFGHSRDMSVIELRSGGIAVRLSWMERLVCLRLDDVQARAGNVVRAFSVDDPWQAIRGIRMPGLGMPFVASVGSWWWRSPSGSGRDFVVVRGHGPGVIVDLVDHEFARLILSVEEPAEVTSVLGRP